MKTNTEIKDENQTTQQTVSGHVEPVVSVPVRRGKTEADAKKAGMHYSEDSQCPECGCGWYGNKNYCGEGHRTCYDCLQEYWLLVSYKEPALRRELEAH